ncbi:MAG TPA: peptide chain release factor N(5)-glutamine methyltransferase [Flavobacteriaceae bacterium]|nr:peptide chain release factor N(5)-glutamine methyltransferase [Flavobacteriaceae bacterium]
MVKNIRQQFHAQLKEIFPSTEIDTFFNLLIEHFAGLSRLDLAMNPKLQLEKVQQQNLEKALERLKNQEPIQYIIGETEFYGLKFKVDKNVLIPRPETEELVDWIIKDTPTTSDLSVLDIGTGSGCIAVSLAANMAEAKVTAWDVSSGALQIARQNATLNKVNVDFQEQDILKTHNPANIKYDIIVSNPPYVRDLEKEWMQPNVLEFEPELALFVKNEDALLFYRKILEFAQNHLSPKGQIYFEINEYLKPELETLLEKYDFEAVEFRQDIFDKTRMLRITAQTDAYC